MSKKGDKKRGRKRNESLQPIFFAQKEFDGTNSEVREHHYPDGSRFVVTRLGARKGGFSFEEAHEVIANAQAYHDALLACGVPLPSIQSMLVEYEPLIDRSVVVKSSPWAGHEVKKMIQEYHHERDIERIEELVTEMVAIIKKIVRQRHKGFSLKIGIDPQASNFIRDDEGVMRYVDLFPTRIRKKGKPIVEWPEPQTKLGKELGHFKHFDLRGIMLTKTAQLARLKPQLKHWFEEKVFSGFSDVLSKKEIKIFYEGLQKTPWMAVRAALRNNNRNEALELIDKSLESRPFNIDYNVYTLREIMLELAQAGLVTEDELENFFKQSHFEDELPEGQLAELKQILHNYVKREELKAS